MASLPAILRVLALVAVGYALLCALLYAVQERLIFFPEHDPPGTRYAFGVPADELFLPVEGAQLHALLFRAREPRGVILYLHGNAGSLRSWGMVAPALVARGYDLLLSPHCGRGHCSTPRLSLYAQR